MKQREYITLGDKLFPGISRLDTPNDYKFKIKEIVDYVDRHNKKVILLDHDKDNNQYEININDTYTINFVNTLVQLIYKQYIIVLIPLDIFYNSYTGILSSFLKVDDDFILNTDNKFEEKIEGLKETLEEFDIKEITSKINKTKQILEEMEKVETIDDVIEFFKKNGDILEEYIEGLDDDDYEDDDEDKDKEDIKDIPYVVKFYNNNKKLSLSKVFDTEEELEDFINKEAFKMNQGSIMKIFYGEYVSNDIPYREIIEHVENDRVFYTIKFSVDGYYDSEQFIFDTEEECHDEFIPYDEVYYTK